MIQAIVNANPNSEFIYVVDTRPKVRLAEVRTLSVVVGTGLGYISFVS